MKEKEFKSLSEKEVKIKVGGKLDYSESMEPKNISVFEFLYPEKDVKEKVQNAQRRLNEVELELMEAHQIRAFIDKVFLEEFGDKLI